MGLTTDPNDPGLRKIQPDGQQVAYLVLSEEERAKGFVRPLRRSYRHLKCGGVTTMGQALCETYAREPHFYTGTFCAVCGEHFPLQETRDRVKRWTFTWTEDGEPVGSDADEAAAFREARLKGEAEKYLDGGV